MFSVRCCFRAAGDGLGDHLRIGAGNCAAPPPSAARSRDIEIGRHHRRGSGRKMSGDHPGEDRRSMKNGQDSGVGSERRSNGGRAGKFSGPSPAGLTAGITERFVNDGGSSPAMTASYSCRSGGLARRRFAGFDRHWADMLQAVDDQPVAESSRRARRARPLTCVRLDVR